MAELQSALVWWLELAVAAGLLVYVTSRLRVRLLVVVTMASFVSRLVVGLALFWVSYLRLPLFQNLQIQGGFWWLAPDAAGYQEAADIAAKALADGGPLPVHAFATMLGLQHLLTGS